MQYITGNASVLPKETYSALFSYRYQVFVEKLGWELDTQYDWEEDEFDRPETVYVIAKSDEEKIIGCARLLPTSSEYLLEKVFPELLNGLEAPKDSSIWELSRFTSIDPTAQNSSLQPQQFSAESTVSLLKASIDSARQRGAKRLISVSPIGIERLLRRSGFSANRLGPPKVLNGYGLVCLSIEIN